MASAKFCLRLRPLLTHTLGLSAGRNGADPASLGVPIDRIMGGKSGDHEAWRRVHTGNGFGSPRSGKMTTID
ncbi:uncharacterized protein B0T15DRAFT_98447 [Chaetomium strumarium]|uniref:Uncharacterized protein n=1 Tax=Chaetomium strumarium TaxID=1170767 RepID=A0AAJ0GXQ5_9PEZI|nr:hypothetical protein B0T15DRAFT_98447 [Chaetomium strumarium]